MKSGTMILGVLSGVAIGALVGILFAPEKGSKTRKQMFGNCDDYTDDLRVEFDELVESILKKYTCTRQEAEALVAEGKAIYDEAMNDLKSTI